MLKIQSRKQQNLAVRHATWKRQLSSLDRMAQNAEQGSEFQCLGLEAKNAQKSKTGLVQGTRLKVSVDWMLQVLF